MCSQLSAQLLVLLVSSKFLHLRPSSSHGKPGAYGLLGREQAGIRGEPSVGSLLGNRRLRRRHAERASILRPTRHRRPSLRRPRKAECG